ncbi:HEPN domain-containing protein [Spirulina major]|uniref:HEPN domain-containing protein n=1 Tax=Spirulina major TaxID=270636 RepID=UPI00111478AA|nr:HEPN domain-containing protein [Spirulina major]
MEIRRSKINYHQNKTKLNNLIESVKSLQDDGLKNELGRYICIRISGLIEKTIISFYEDYTQNKSSPEIHKYVSKRLQGFQNPNINKIITLARDFNDAWGNEIEDLDDGIKAAVDSIVAIRNNAAHGGEQNTRLQKIEEYYKLTLKLLDHIQQQCDL